METLEQKLTTVIESRLMALEVVAALGEIHVPFRDRKISLPAVFIRCRKEEEMIPNTRIFSIKTQVELRYLPERSTHETMSAVWAAIDDSLTGVPFNVLADQLCEYRPDLFVHSVELGESETVTRDGERHFLLTLDIGCATV